MNLTFSDLLEVARESVPMRSIYDHFGLNYFHDTGDTQCKCPFHGRDRHPSAKIYDDTNSWYCFTCGFSKTPFSFYKAMMTEKPLTDALHDFIIEFLPEILEDRPELSEETFTKDEIMLAYHMHLRDSHSLLNAISLHIPNTFQDKVTLPSASPEDTDSAKFYRATRAIWETSFRSPNFLPLYFEFTNRLNRISKSPTNEECSQFNIFLGSLEKNLRSFS